MPSAEFRRLAEERRFDSRVFVVDTVHLEDPDGQPFDRDLVRHPGAVAVIPLHADGTVTLVRQFRASVMQEILEAPAGTCDAEGESLEDTARRELVEEAGLAAGQLRKLAAVRNSPGFCDQLTTIFLATDLTAVPTAREGVEEQWMSVVRLPLAEVAAMVADGRVVDETTALGVLLAR